jgi:hypothetical protein
MGIPAADLMIILQSWLSKRGTSMNDLSVPAVTQSERKARNRLRFVTGKPVVNEI